MTKSQSQIDKEAKEAAAKADAENLSQETSPEAAALEAEANKQPDFKPGQDPVTTPPPEVYPPQVAPEQKEIAVETGRVKAPGIPSADEIRALHRPEMAAPVEDWMSRTRDQLGDFLRERVEALNAGTELEFGYPTTNAHELSLWRQHYIKFQGELQTAGYKVFMIGGAHNPLLRIKLDTNRKVVAE